MQASFHIYCGRSTERLGQNHHTLGWEMENPELHSLEFWVTDCKRKRLDFANFKQGVLTSPLQKKKKNLVNPTETRTTTWQGINPLDNGIMVPQRAWTPTKPVPDFDLFWLCRQAMAMLTFLSAEERSSFFFLSLPLPSQVTGATAQDIIPKLRQPLRRLESRSHFDPRGHWNTKEASTVDREWPSQPRPQLTPHYLFSRKTKHTCKAHWVRCTHTPRCVEEQTLAEKEINWCRINELNRQRALAYVFVDYFPGSCNPQVFFLHDFSPSFLFPHFAERYFIFLKDLL